MLQLSRETPGADAGVYNRRKLTALIAAAAFVGSVGSAFAKPNVNKLNTKSIEVKAKSIDKAPSPGRVSAQPPRVSCWFLSGGKQS